MHLEIHFDRCKPCLGMKTTYIFKTGAKHEICRDRIRCTFHLRLSYVTRPKMQYVFIIDPLFFVFLSPSPCLENHLIQAWAWHGQTCTLLSTPYCQVPLLLIFYSHIDMNREGVHFLFFSYFKQFLQALPYHIKPSDC